MFCSGFGEKSLDLGGRVGGNPGFIRKKMWDEEKTQVLGGKVWIIINLEDKIRDFEGKRVLDLEE